jgi:hypothetical protein
LAPLCVWPVRPSYFPLSPMRTAYPYPVPQLVWSSPMAVAVEDDEELSMWPVVVAAVILAVVLAGLMLIMAYNDDTQPRLPTGVSEHVSTP